jgi:hypothetical protein
MRTFKLAFALFFLLAASQTRAAGVRFIEIAASPAGPAMAGAVWYPCAEPAQVINFGDKNCRLVGDQLPWRRDGDCLKSEQFATSASANELR